MAFVVMSYGESGWPDIRGVYEDLDVAESCVAVHMQKDINAGEYQSSYSVLEMMGDVTRSVRDYGTSQEHVSFSFKGPIDS